jgi:hypothetical protein
MEAWNFSDKHDDPAEHEHDEEAEEKYLREHGCEKVTFDWKENGSECFIAILKQLGCTVANDPVWEGSDQYSFVIYHPDLVKD